jgi:protein-S-isoprenylcysteine O-methyltransferase Ste14
MSELNQKFLQFEFEYRVYISLLIISAVCAPSLLLFSNHPLLSQIIGKLAGCSPEVSLSLGYLSIAAILTYSSKLRMWAGSILSANRMMAFQVQTDVFLREGPYKFVRNPIYLADLLAYCAFSLCLPQTGLLLPILMYGHYRRLIRFEEQALCKKHFQNYITYSRQVNRLFPPIKDAFCLLFTIPSGCITGEGFRHNANYVLLIPGFLIAAFTHNILHALVIGLPGVVAWTYVHIRIGRQANSKKRTNTDSI